MLEKILHLLRTEQGMSINVQKSVEGQVLPMEDARMTGYQQGIQLAIEIVSDLQRGASYEELLERLKLPDEVR